MKRAVHEAEVFEGRDGGWYYRVKARNGRTIGPSQRYASRYNAERGVWRNTDCTVVWHLY